MMSAVYWNNTRIFEAFTKLEKKISDGFQQKKFRFFGFSHSVIAERLIQHFIQLTFFTYARDCAVRHAQSQFPLPVANKIKLAGLWINQENGQVKPTVGFFINCLLKFFFLWIRLLGYIVRSFTFSGPLRKQSTTLVFGLTADIIFYNGSDERFISYLRSGPVSPLAESVNKIIYSATSQKSNTDKNVIYHPLPVEALIRNGGFGFFQVLSLLKEHIKTLFIFLFSATRQPLLVTLYSDAAYSLIIQKMDSWKAIDHVVITNSNFQQYTWMQAEKRNFVVHQVYYSQNIKPFIYKQDPVSADYPGYRHTNVDEVWVWGNDISNYLQELGFKKKINIVGPILWYLPGTKEIESRPNFDIVIFDVTPFTKEREIELGVINNYYSAENLVRYIRDIIQTCEEINERYQIKIRLFLKHKRAIETIHDMTYVNFINSMLGSGRITAMIDPKEDVYSLLSKTALSITIPFSSTSVVADTLNRPAIIYDFSDTLINNYETTENTRFVSEKSDLKKQVIQILDLENKELSTPK